MRFHMLAGVTMPLRIETLCSVAQVIKKIKHMILAGKHISSFLSTYLVLLFTSEVSAERNELNSVIGVES